MKTQKIVHRRRTLALIAGWIEMRSPSSFLLRGMSAAITLIFLRWLLEQFYWLFLAMPWIVLGLAIALASLSFALRVGKKN